MLGRLADVAEGAVWRCAEISGMLAAFARKDQPQPEMLQHSASNPSGDEARVIGWRVGVWLMVSVAFAAFGATLVRQSEAVAATTWMHMYSPADFSSVRDLITFLRELRVPIPPVISALEILSVQQWGSTDLVTKHLYRISLVGSYVLALWLTYPSVPRLAAAAVTAVIFLWATTLLHPINPQVYDLVLPLCMLAFLFLLRGVRITAPGSLAAPVFAASAGFCLAMAELARPFVFVMLPVLLLGAYGFLQSYPRRVYAALVIPVVVLNGIWHLHLFVAHGQVLATNYAGFNLRRAWPQAPLPDGMFESSSTPADEQSWPNINTKEQHVASQLLQRTIARYALTHPLDAARHAARRMVYFARPQTSMYGSTEPGHSIMAAYKVAVPATVALLLVNLIVLGCLAIRARRRCLYVLGRIENLVILFASFALIALSLGEAAEEARLVVTILPFLAACPRARAAATSPAILNSSDAEQPHTALWLSARHTGPSKKEGEEE